jgi:hypothetical protein
LAVPAASPVAGALVRFAGVAASAGSFALAVVFAFFPAGDTEYARSRKWRPAAAVVAEKTAGERGDAVPKAGQVR